MVKITGVIPNSSADKHGILEGDVLISIDDKEINDVLDYRFYLSERSISLLLSRNGELYSVKIKKREYDDIGLEFETPLMDKKHSCENKCIFCFIDQLPRGMRDSLYFKDDDSRLSFLHGNYITMTNMNDYDVERIIEMHISPVNVSIHTTNPELRCKMMKNRFAGEKLKYLKKIADAGLTIRGQIVLCKGINDGEELLRTMKDLAELYPQLDSVSIVTAGLTGYRDGLYPLESYTPEECRSLIKMVDDFSNSVSDKIPTRLFYCSDEIYVKGNVELPPYEYWGEFSQIENGVGMLSAFEREFDVMLNTLSEEEKQVKRKVSLATGEAAYDFISNLCRRLMSECPGLEMNLYCIKNEFFGGEITVSGLLTGVDIEKQLKGKDLGEALLLPSNVLRADGDLFLCGMTPKELSENLNVEVLFSGPDGGDLIIKALGLDI